MAEIYEVGPHLWRHQGDIVWITFGGELVLADAERFISLAKLASLKPRSFFFVFDLRTSSKPPEPAARSLLMDWTQINPPIGTAVLGGGFLMRTFATLANRALNLLSNQPTPMRFFSSEDEVYRWIDKRRDEFQREREAGGV